MTEAGSEKLEDATLLAFQMKGGSGAKEHGQPLEPAKDRRMDFPLESPEGTQPEAL